MKGSMNSIEYGNEHLTSRLTMLTLKSRNPLSSALLRCGQTSEQILKRQSDSNQPAIAAGRTVKF